MTCVLLAWPFAVGKMMRTAPAPVAPSDFLDSPTASSEIPSPSRSPIDAIDEPIPDDVRKTIVDRRVSVLDVYGSWDAKKKGEAKG